MNTELDTPETLVMPTKLGLLAAGFYSVDVDPIVYLTVYDAWEMCTDISDGFTTIKGGGGSVCIVLPTAAIKAVEVTETHVSFRIFITLQAVRKDYRNGSEKDYTTAGYDFKHIVRQSVH